MLNMLNTLNGASDNKFYKFLRPLADYDLPNFDKTAKIYRTHLQTHAGGGNHGMGH